MKKLVISTILIATVFLSALYSENRALPLNSILFILDSSYSMHIDNRFELATESIKNIINNKKLEQNTEWALISFGNDNDSKIETVVQFTQNKKSIEKALFNLKPWGISPIGKAFDYSKRYLKIAAKGKRKIIILISDCISTEPNERGFLDYVNKYTGTIREEEINIFTIFIPPIENPELTNKINKIIPNIFKPEETDALISKIQFLQKAPPQTIEDKTSKSKGETHVRKKEIGGIVFTIVFIPLILISLFLTFYLFSKKRYIEEKKPMGKIPIINVEIVSSSGKREQIWVTTFPFTIGTTGKEKIFLPKAGNIARGKTCTIAIQNGNPVFQSNKPVTLNGVDRKNKKLKTGDFFILGKYRVFIRKITEETIYEKTTKKSILPYLILIIGFSLLIFQIIVLFPSVKTGKTNTSSATKTTNETIAPKKIPIKRSSVKKKEVIIYKPGERISFFKAHILFIHAHPDDESLDFGCLMARASRAGKKIVTVLLTDGEGGIDQYPNRKVSTIYPSHDLHGSNLAKVRIKEAENAMAILGSDVYIRLGLKNHPYNSIKEQLSINRVLQDWGGEDKIVKKLITIIKGFKPDIIVSPDIHTNAYEHFEHETTGYLVRKAVEKLRKQDNFLKGLIVSVDPLQKHLYNKKIMINGMVTRKDSYTPRMIQQMALREHITQRDASVIGVEVLPNFEYEYYHPIFWDINTTLENYLSK